MSSRDRDLEAVQETYSRYRSQGRKKLWDRSNSGYRRIAEDRDRALVRLLAESAPSPARVLDVGCGDGSLAALARKGGMPIASWTGVDVDATAVADASQRVPWARFIEASADDMPFPDGTFDVIVVATLFSSLTDLLERAVAAEIARVAGPDAALVWYDLRYDNPTNPAVHGLRTADVRRLFPGWDIHLSSLTLVPPLARRLGSATRILYPVLHGIPPLRGHLVGRLTRDKSGPPA